MVFLSHETREKEGFEFELCKVRLGSGGSGTVFLAQHAQTRELVAVKRLFAKNAAECEGYLLSSAPCETDDHHHPREECNPAANSSSTSASSGMATTISARSDQSDVQSDVDDSSSNHSDHNDAICAGSENSLEGVEEKERRDAQHNGVKKGVLRFLAGVQTPRAAPLPCECTILRSLDPHHHIVKFLDSYTTSGRVTFVAMELMDSDVGRELRAVNTAFMSEDVARPLLYGVVSAIVHLHNRGIVHRDIKPSNILLRRVDTARTTADAGRRLTVTASNANGRHNTHNTERQFEQSFLDEKKSVKAALGDFSAAHFIHEAVRVGSRRGTLYYKAPEQLLGRADDFFACDMWALGCTVFELCTGSVAFRGSTDLQVLHQIYNKLGTNFQFCPIKVCEETLFDGVPAPSPGLLSLLKGLLALDPRERLTANEALRHVFFEPIRQKHGAQCDNVEMTFPLSLRCCRPLDTIQHTFRPITNAFSQRSAVAIAGDFSRIQCGVNALDTSSSCSGKKCSPWSLSFSVSPSPLPCYAQIGSNHESMNASRRRSRVSSGWGTCNAARRLSVSFCTPREGRDNTREKEDTSKATARVISPVTLRFSPGGGASNSLRENMRANNAFERAAVSVECGARGGSGCPAGPRVLFEDDANLSRNDMDTPRVQKILFTAS